MKRSLKALKFLTIGIVALVAIALLANVVVNSMANSRLESKIGALRDAGQPVAIIDLVRTTIPPESNAATYLRRAQADVEAIQKEVSAVSDAAPQLDQDRFDEGHLSPTLKNAIQAAFAAYPKVMGLLVQAAACPDYDRHLDLTADTGAFQESELINISASRAVMRVLNYQAMQQIADGNQEEALRTCLLMFRLCRHFDHGPMLTNYLVAVACRGVAVGTTNLALRIGPLTDASRDALDAELGHHETVEPFQNALITERSFGLQRYRELSRELNFGPIGLPWLKNDACGYIDLFGEVISLAGRPYADAERELATSSAVANAGPLTRILVPTLQAMIEATCRVRAQMRALRVLNALARHSDVDNAAEPKLSHLGLPADVTIDPFDGKPLHLKKLPDGWLIYAVGKNLKDDGGKLADLQDIGLGPPTATEKRENADASEPGSM